MWSTCPARPAGCLWRLWSRLPWGSCFGGFARWRCLRGSKNGGGVATASAVAAAALGPWRPLQWLVLYDAAQPQKPVRGPHRIGIPDWCPPPTPPVHPCLVCTHQSGRSPRDRSQQRSDRVDQETANQGLGRAVDGHQGWSGQPRWQAGRGSLSGRGWGVVYGGGGGSAPPWGGGVY